MKNIVALLLSSPCLLIQTSNKNSQQKFEEIAIVLFIILFNIIIGTIIYYYIKRKNVYQNAEHTKKLQSLANPHLFELKDKMIKKEVYETSSVYLKVKNIVRTLIKVDTKENLNEEEWKVLTAQTDIKWNHIITYLKMNFGLSPEEVKICCLYLGDVPVKHVGHFVNGYARSTIQLKAREIIIKIGAPPGSLLKEVLLSLSNELANVK